MLSIAISLPPRYHFAYAWFLCRLFVLPLGLEVPSRPPVPDSVIQSTLSVLQIYTFSLQKSQIVIIAILTITRLIKDLNLSYLIFSRRMRMCLFMIISHRRDNHVKLSPLSVHIKWVWIPCHELIICWASHGLRPRKSNYGRLQVAASTYYQQVTDAVKAEI